MYLYQSHISKRSLILFSIETNLCYFKSFYVFAGQAFGVGALEEDDDDIYTSDKFSNYDRVLGGPDNTGTYGWTAPTNKGLSYSGAVLFWTHQ